MRYDFAPLEGLTDSVFRRLHHQYFPGVDRYFMPFFSPTVHRSLTPRENRELPYADSVDFVAVPQLLTKVPEDFLWMAQQCADRGYREVNLNVGCPSGTVVSKGKGAGMLADPSQLDAFLDGIFSHAPLAISVKTRLGITDPQEFPALLAVFNRYPIKTLTIHPRVRKAFYQGDVDMEMFRYAYQTSTNPLCYNGEVKALAQAEALAAQFPGLDGVMIGRGLIENPGLLTPGGTTVEALEGFYEDLLEAYLVEFGGSRNAMFRLKESWQMVIGLFEGNEKLRKRLLKATDLTQYRSITQEIFHTLPLRQPLSR